MAKRIHIIIAEPSEIIRCGISTLLQRASMSDLNIDIAEASDMQSVMSMQNRQAPDILIVSPFHLGMFSVAQLRVELGNDNLKIIALQSSFADQGMAQNYDATISIYDGIGAIKDKINSVVSEQNDDTKKDLSVREREIIVCVVKGMTNKQIADALYLSTHTVIAHRRNIASKLQIHSPSGLTIYAIVNKLVDLSDIKDSISKNKEEI